jgi:two-component system sensor histidine kinase YesM
MDSLWRTVRAGETDWKAPRGGEHILAKYSGATGLTVVQVTPHDEILAGLRKTQISLLGVICIILAILMILIRIFSDSITSPIHKLVSVMRVIEQKDFSARADEDRGDEFGVLSHAFNSMVSLIRTLIEEDYRKKLLLREAQYRYLQAQIKPHFIYNTLDSINWMANKNGMKDISQMAFSLGRLLRRSIAVERGVTTLREEIDSLRDYITIQKVRFGDRLQVRLDDIPADLGDCLVPEMLLQPLVENSIVHGVEKTSAAGLVSVRVRQSGNDLEIFVEDDGCGMSEEQIEQVMTGTWAKDMNDDKSISGGLGVGIYNVHQRIQMHFGAEYGITIKSGVKDGTTVKLLLRLHMPPGEEV